MGVRSPHLALRFGRQNSKGGPKVVNSLVVVSLAARMMIYSRAVASLVAMLPTSFQDMIFESQGTSDISYKAVRDKVLAVTGSKI